MPPRREGTVVQGPYLQQEGRGGQRRDYGSQDGDSRPYYRQNSRGRGRGRRGRGRDGRGRGGYYDPEGKHMRVVNPEPPEVVTSDVSAALAGLVPGSKKPPSRTSSASRLQDFGQGRGGFDSSEMHRSQSYRTHKYNINSYKQQRHLQQQYQYSSNERASTKQHMSRPPRPPQTDEQFTNEPHFVQEEEIEREFVKDKDSAGAVDANMVHDVEVDAQDLPDSSADEEQVEYDEEEEDYCEETDGKTVTDPIVKLWLQHVNDDNQIDSLKHSSHGKVTLHPTNLNSISLHQNNDNNTTQDLYEAQQSMVIDANKKSHIFDVQQQQPQQNYVPKIATQNVSTAKAKKDLVVHSAYSSAAYELEHKQQFSPKDSLDGYKAQAPELQTQEFVSSQEVQQQMSRQQQRSREVFSPASQQIFSQDVANVEDVEQVSSLQQNRSSQIKFDDRKVNKSKDFEESNYNATPRIDELRPEVPECNVKLLTQKFNQDLKSPAVKNKLAMLRTNSSITRRPSYAHRDSNNRELRTTQSFGLPQPPSQSLSSHNRTKSHDEDVSDTTSQMSTESSRISRLRQGWEEGAPKKEGEDEGESRSTSGKSNKASIAKLMEKFKSKGSSKPQTQEEQEVEDSTKGVKKMALKVFQSQAAKPQRKTSVKSESIIGQMMARYETK
eukprot:TRINITY_DN1781_c0_g1_i4.p1 TRINITY_DN1781_c0_g1~~TRINITY_DN1781_c0_g1_i4.p1  ORF type:complete len:665 (-),score=117.06 TRINITY_DN1781_c0_g1_i4:630-2624(-)